MSIHLLPLRYIEGTVLTGTSATIGHPTGIADRIPPGTKHLVNTFGLFVNYGAAESRLVKSTFNGVGGTSYLRQVCRASSTTVSSLGSGTGADFQSIDAAAHNATGFCGGMMLIPWAMDEKYKLAITQCGSYGERVMHGMTVVQDAAALDAILHSVFDGGTVFSIGSYSRLWAVDEDCLLLEETLGSDGFLTLENIPQGHQNIVAMAFARSNEAATTDGSRLDEELNGESNQTKHWQQRLAGEQPTNVLDELWQRSRFAYVPSADSDADSWGYGGRAYVAYDSATKHKYSITTGADGSDYRPTQLGSGRWADTDPITDITIKNTADSGGGTALEAGSQATVYRTHPSVSNETVGSAGAATVRVYLPANTGHCTILVNARTDAAARYDFVNCSANGDTTDANYTLQEMRTTITSYPPDGVSTNYAGTASGSRADSRKMLVVPAASADANVFGGGALTFFEHSVTTKHKSFLSEGGAAEYLAYMAGGAWQSDAAITYVDFTPVAGTKFLEGSTFEVLLPQGTTAFCPGSAGSTVEVNSISYSYSDTPATGNIAVYSPPGTVIFEQDVRAAGPGQAQFPNGLTGAVGEDLVVVLAVGGDEVQGHVSATLR